MDLSALPHDITMPPAFPMEDFFAFHRAGQRFFPKLMSDEDVNDPQANRTYFNSAWQAVRYRYRSCADCNEEFKDLLANKSKMWREAWDEEFTYELEHCIYVFIMGSLSVFDSFGFCLYFLGSRLKPESFSEVSRPERITLKETCKAFHKAFENEAITTRLKELMKNRDFTTIKELRNVLAHRVSGQPTVWSSGVRYEDGTFVPNWHKETFDTPGATGSQTLHEEWLERHLNEITSLLIPMISAAREFAESQTSAAGMQA